MIGIDVGQVRIYRESAGLSKLTSIDFEKYRLRKRERACIGVLGEAVRVHLAHAAAESNRWPYCSYVKVCYSLGPSHCCPLTRILAFFSCTSATEYMPLYNNPGPVFLFPSAPAGTCGSRA